MATDMVHFGRRRLWGQVCW
eukprot:CCRYP_006478-RE/>CCRYP_006478-RE protein AED:0.49 eAED:0.49 QI:0/-1/0/1/-1/0/1/0/19